MALLETEVRILSRPIDLSADVSELVGSGEWFFVQNTGHTEIRFRETAASPALGDKGARPRCRGWCRLARFPVLLDLAPDR